MIIIVLTTPVPTPQSQEPPSPSPHTRTDSILPEGEEGRGRIQGQYAVCVGGGRTARPGVLLLLLVMLAVRGCVCGRRRGRKL